MGKLFADLTQTGLGKDSASAKYYPSESAAMDAGNKKLAASDYGRPQFVINNKADALAGLLSGGLQAATTTPPLTPTPAANVPSPHAALPMMPHPDSAAQEVADPNVQLPLPELQVRNSPAPTETIQQPSFAQASEQGRGLSKKGNFFNILLAAAKGGLAGDPRTAEGYQRAVMMPGLQKKEQLGIEQDELQNEALKAQAQYAPMLTALGLKGKQLDIEKTGAEIKKLGREADQPASSHQTITTDQGIFQFNPATGRYDIPAGKPAPKTDTAISEVELARDSVNPDPKISGPAKAALDALTGRRVKQAQASRPVDNSDPRGTGVPLEDKSGKPVIFFPKSGTVVPVPEGLDRADKPPSEAQLKALGFYERAKQANDIFGSSEKAVAEMGFFDRQRMQHLPQFAQTDEGKAYLNGARAWIKAVLRLDSGAAIPPEEEKQFMITYFAQPGDGPKDLEKKAAARAAAEESLKIQGDRAYKARYGTDPKAKSNPHSDLGFVPLQ